MRGSEATIQLYGLREIATGLAILATGSPASVWSRVGGDALEIGTLVTQLDGNPKRSNVAMALAAVGGVTMLDVACVRALTSNQSRGPR